MLQTEKTPIENGLYKQMNIDIFTSIDCSVQFFLYLKHLKQGIAKIQALVNGIYLHYYG